jgi:electron transport complex protein RnfG
MKRIFSLYAAMLLAVASYADDVMTKQSDGTYVVNTTTLCQARGYKSVTPVEVYIKSGKVLKVVALKNTETPGYFKKAVKGLLGLFEGQTISKALELAEASKVDACTGATMSTKALQQNIKVALEYYKSNSDSHKRKGSR